MATNLPQPTLFDLSERGKIELVGPDARFFLHNLCTNDVKNLPLGAGCEAFLTTAKARVVAHILIGHHERPTGTVLLVDFVPGMSDKVFEHFNRYLISEQVELADRTGEFALFRLTNLGPTFLTEMGVPPDLPHLHHHRSEIAGAIVELRPHGLLAVPSVDVLCAIAAADRVRHAVIDMGFQPGDAAAYDVLRVEGGLPEFGRDIDENRMVVEVGRIKQAISYNKGCYLGQEPIVMARDRGHVNRTLLGLKIAGREPVAGSVKVLRGSEEVGLATSSVWSPRFQAVLALAYMKRGNQEPGTKVVVEGREAEVTALPFNFISEAGANHASESLQS